MKKGLRSRLKPWVTPIHASVKLAIAGLNFRAFDLLNVYQIAIEKCVCCALLFSARGEREVFLVLENEENENTETWVYIYIYIYINGNGWVEFEYIVFGLNGSQWVFS